MTASPLVDLFLRQESARPNQPALVQGGRTTTYRELHQRMMGAAGILHRLGVGPGHRVLVFVPPSADLYALLLAIWHRGAVAVFVDAWTSRKRLGDVAQLVEPHAFVGIPKAHLLRLLHPSLRRIPCLWWWRDRTGPALGDPAQDVAPDSPALITFTTGSTGSPKGALRSHAFLLAQHRALSRVLGTRPGSRVLATLPIFALHDLASGATCQLAAMDPARPDSIDAPRFLSELRSCEEAVGSPAVFLAAARSLQKPDPSVDARIHIGGAAIFPQTIRELSQAFPNADWTAVYGSTEAEPIASLQGSVLAVGATDPAEGIHAGAVDPGLTLRILRISDEPIVAQAEQDLSCLEVPAGEVGEIVVAGPHVLESYWNDPEATRRHKIRTETATWHRTGDAGRLDAQGNLHLMGRTGERFSWQGRTYFPFAIQGLLQEIPEIAASHALATDRGIVLAVEPKARADREAIRARILDCQIPFPFTLHFCEIPRDPRHRSKVDSSALRWKLEREGAAR